MVSEPTTRAIAKDYPSWLRVERVGAGLRIYASPRLDAEGKLGVGIGITWLIFIGWLDAERDSSIAGLLPYLATLSAVVLASIFHLASLALASPGQAKVRVGPGWIEVGSHWWSRRRIDRSSLRGLGLRVTPTSGVGQSVPFRIELTSGSPADVDATVTALVEQIPSEPVAQDLLEQIREAFGPIEPRVDAVVPIDARIRFVGGRVTAEWGWLNTTLAADDEALTLRRPFLLDWRFDADEIRDLRLDRPAHSDRARLSVILTRGREILLLHGRRPGLAERLLPDLRRALRLDGASPPPDASTH